MSNNQWGDDNPYKGAQTDDGAGTYTGGVGVHIDPKTGKIDPSYHPSAQPSGGGGAPLGGAGGSGGGAATTTAGATAASTTGTAAATYLGMTVPQWLQSALALYGAYRSSQPGKFQQIPESPLQTAARQKLLGFVDNSPTRDLLGNLISQRLGAAHPFELPKGTGGYNPYPTGNAPSYDLSSILPMLAPHAGTAAAPASAGASSDSVGQWLTAHPEVLQMGVNVAAGAVAAQFRIPQDQALQIVTAHVESQQTQLPSQTPAMIGATP